MQLKQLLIRESEDGFDIILYCIYGGNRSVMATHWSHLSSWFTLRVKINVSESNLNIIRAEQLFKQKNSREKGLRLAPEQCNKFTTSGIQYMHCTYCTVVVMCSRRRPGVGNWRELM